MSANYSEIHEACKLISNWLSKNKNAYTNVVITDTDFCVSETLEYQVKRILLEQYGSVKHFSNVHKIPYHTVNNAFKRGFSCIKLKNLGLILHALGISGDSVLVNKVVYLKDS